jgi:bifunctional UDP-N-acetylglucosamine pyrophosphorylase/glucosamine-1-phosphate N-acetyltransferase
MSRLAIVILAAGQGTRVKSHRSKLLLELAGRPLVAYPLRLAGALEPAHLVLVLGHLADQVQEALGLGYTYVLQEPQLGTGHAVQQSQALLAGQCDEVLVLYGDTPLLRKETIAEMARQHRAAGAVLSLLSGIVDNPHGYGRVVRDPAGRVQAVVEHADCTPEQRAVQEINSGILLFQADWLWQHLSQIPRSPKGEYYLPHLIAQAVDESQSVLAYPAPDPAEIMGINDRVQLAEAAAVLRQRILERHMRAGVTIVDPATTYIDDEVEIVQDTTIRPNTHILGQTRIGADCEIGPNAIIVDTVIGDHCQILASVLESATLEDNVDIGPFGHLRKGAYLCAHVHMGNFGEVKNSRLGPGVKMGHFSYVGDADIGEETNIGAGTITCNFDVHGRKNRTVVGKRAYIGSDTMLVAPVELGDDAVTGAGAVVTRDVPPGGVAYGVPARLKKTVEEVRGLDEEE